MLSTTFNRIWNKEFANVTLSKTSEFSKCVVCSRIKSQLESTKDGEMIARLKDERRIHMMQQQSCRNVYYTWRKFSQMQKDKYLCIIHDKMDQKKTTIPRLRVNSKDYANAYQLQVSLTGMITHGHGHGMYGNFSLNGLWPSDPNATIGSLALCLQNLERIESHGLGDLCHDGMPRSNVTLFNALNSRTALDHQNKIKRERDGRASVISPVLEIEGCNGENASSPNLQRASSQCAIDAMSTPTFRKLPENLLLQLDNCAGENKNRYLFAYLSLLVAKGVFKTVHLGFLMVGHTHEDIDAMFSRFSERLQTEMMFTFPHLMEHFQKCESSAPAPILMTQVPDFKSFVQGYLCDGQDSLVGHSKPLQFRFYMQGELPVMQYKIHPKSPDWMPRESGIELWKRDDQGKPKLPPSCPNVVPIAEYVRDSPLVIQGIKAYLEFWKKCSAMKGKDHDSTKYMEPIILYWQNMISEVEKPTNNHICQYIGFWPKTTRTHRMQQIEEDRDEFQGFEEFNDHFVGPQSARPLEAFKPQIDVKKGDFVLVRPADPEYPVCLGVVESDVDLDFSSPNHKKVFIQYWAPKHQKRNPTIHE